MSVGLGTTILGLIREVFEFSEDLRENDPEVVSVGTQVHLSWAETAVEGEAAGSVIDIYLNARPMAPGTITAKNANPASEKLAAAPAEHTSNFAPVSPNKEKTQKRSQSLRIAKQSAKPEYSKST